jgi:hypothetical protein
MKTYTITGYVSCSYEYEIRAKSRDVAEMKAEQMMLDEFDTDSGRDYPEVKISNITENN